jgi:excisionase family DNA binding protein
MVQGRWTAVSKDESRWLSLGEASQLLGVHFTTLRRWADAGAVPCIRTPGGHRRFRRADLEHWMEGTHSTALVPAQDALVQSAVGYARQEMAEQGIHGEPWHAAFSGSEDRREMAEMGRSLFGLAFRFITRTQRRERVLKEGQRIGQYYGQQCAERGVPLVETARAFIFFRRSLVQAVGPGQAGMGQFDAEDARIQRNLNHYLDEVLCACLESYEQHCREMLKARGGEQ